MMRKETVIVVSAGAAVGLAAIFLMLLGNPANMGFCIACFLRDIAGACGLHNAAKELVVGGISTYGKVAVVLGLIVMLVVGLMNLPKEEAA